MVSYAIRGTMHRDTLQWVAALDLMLDLQPSLLVPQHTRPLSGWERIRETMTAYRDAIQFVHDQTVRMMNKGLSGRETAELVRLPPHLAEHPYLTEYYGTVEWSVRAVFNGYIGWFSGRPSDLHPLPLSQETELMVELAGGRRNMLDKLRQAVSRGNYQWGLKLSDYLVDIESSEQEEVKDLRSKCLQTLAYREVSAPGMNWYLTEDLVMRGLQIQPSQAARAQRIKSGDIRALFLMLTCMLDDRKTQDVVMTSVFKFPDTESLVVVTIRRGVCVLSYTAPPSPDMEVVTAEKVFREILAKERNALSAFTTGELSVSSGIREFARFFGYFDTE